MRVAGLFGGIGGIELGLASAGMCCELMSEIDPFAVAVLQERFPETEVVGDIRSLRSLPAVEIVTAGFPCNDLSQAGRRSGITGQHSGLIHEVFRLIAARKRRPDWVLLENVPFILRLQRGRGMREVTAGLEALGYQWAYRVVDTRSFGIPQRRNRMILLASTKFDARAALLSQNEGPKLSRRRPRSYGFYSTEGSRGVGWAEDSIPTLKAGSTIGIPSPPAMWTPLKQSFTVPNLRDAERLQGFPASWTSPAQRAGARPGDRWRLVGNAVSVPVSRWIGRRLRLQEDYLYGADDRRLRSDEGWPLAGWGRSGERFESPVSAWPEHHPMTPLHDFLRFPERPLSYKAASGFLRRALKSNLRFTEGFLEALDDHVRKVDEQQVP